MGMNELDKRDKSTIFFAALFFLLALFMLFYVPNSWGKRYKAAKAQVVQKQQELQLAKLDKVDEEERVQRQEKMRTILNSRDSHFDLFSFINRTVADTGLAGRAKLENSRRPRGLSAKHPLVDLELSGVSLQEFIELMYKIRSSNNLIAVYTMQVEPMVREKGLHCKATFVSVKL